MRVYYYGCEGPDMPGHYLFDVDPVGTYSKLYTLFTELTKELGDIDGGFAPRNVHQQQGAAKVTHVKGWTILAWWDRSGDRRYGSNSVLLAEGTFTFEQMRQLLAIHFPSVLSRQPEQLVPV